MLFQVSSRNTIHSKDCEAREGKRMREVEKETAKKSIINSIIFYALHEQNHEMHTHTLACTLDAAHFVLRVLMLHMVNTSTVLQTNTQHII